MDTSRFAPDAERVRGRIVSTRTSGVNPPPPGTARFVRDDPHPGSGVRFAADRRGDRRLVIDLRWTHVRLALVFVALALLAVLTNQPRWYVADARFEQFWDPGGFLRDHRTVWDGVRTLGTPSLYFSPVVGTILTAVRGLGASPALAERLLHATYLVVGGLGMVQVLRLFRPHLGVEHALAGALFMFNPYTSQFLTPSGLFLHYALVPWMVTAVVQGVRGRDRGRWAGVFALTVFVPGATNGASLAYALLPAVIAGAVTLIAERPPLRRALTWAAATSVLTACAASAALVHTALNAPVVAENLATTELPRTVSRTSSWSESWRGLGFWLTYFRSPLGGQRLEATGFFQRPDIIVVTYLLPVTALITAVLTRWRGRLLMLAVMAIALVAMVGIHPVADPPWLGRLLAEGYEDVPFLRSLRSGYKAGAGWALGVSGLVAIGVVALVRAGRRAGPGRRRLVRSLPAAATAVVVIAAGLASFPFWSGNLYSSTDRVRAVPDYWTEALDWLDAQPAAGHVFILPGATRARYRWGYVGDDIFDALLDRPHVSRASLSQGTPLAADLVAALDDEVTSSGYEPGTIGPIARRLGIRWILVRNDLAWDVTDRPRPFDLEHLRADPDLVLVETFGRPGENTTRPGDDAALVLGEQRLPPVEIYALRGATDAARLADPPTPFLVSGDGHAWSGLAADGLLRDQRPIRYTADTSADEIAILLDGGATAVVSDSNRRHVTQVTSERNFESHTLAAGETLARTPVELFDRDGAEAVATFGDATRITASRYGGGFQVFPTWMRPAAAFDRDPATAWLVGGADPSGEWIAVEFGREQRVSHLDLVPAAGGRRRITAAAIEFPDGSSVTTPVRPGGTRVEFAERATTSLRIRITDVSRGSTGLVGFSEIALPGIDAAERIRAPEDLFRLADADPRVERALTTSGLRYTFRRRVGAGPIAEEPALRRSFMAAGTRNYRLGGTVRVDRTTPDASIDALFGGQVGAFGSSRSGGLLEGGGWNAIDFDPDTAWAPRPEHGETLTVRFPTQLVDHVDVLVTRDTAVPARVSSPGRIGVRLDDRPSEFAAIVDPDGECEPSDPDDLFCQQRIRIAFPATTASTVSVVVRDVDIAEGPFGARAVSIPEVRPGLGPFPLFEAQTLQMPPVCQPLVAVDGSVVTASLLGTIEDVLAGRPVTVSGCRSVSLGPGRHGLDSTALGHHLVDRVRLTTGSLGGGDNRRILGAVEVLDRSPTHLRFRVNAPPDGGVFLPGLTYHRGWEASIGSTSLGAPRAIDTLAGWAVPAGSTVVDVRFGPQHTYEAAMALTSAAVVLALALVVRRRSSP